MRLGDLLDDGLAHHCTPSLAWRRALALTLNHFMSSLTESASSIFQMASMALCLADLVITGEGRLDGQTIHGKTPAGVARLAKEQGIPVVAIAGTLGAGYEAVYNAGIDAAFSICPGPVSLSDAMAHATEWLAGTGEAIARVWRASGGRHAPGL